MPTTTTTYSFNKPVVGADEDDWGGYLNGNWDSVDDLLDGTTPVTGIDINSGTIDNVVIGGATPAAGTFTTLTANTSITGTLATAAQPNITSVGTLTGLTVSASVSLAGASTTADITFGDNDKAIFGAGNDLQIYHDGTTNYVYALADININANTGVNIQAKNGKESIVAEADGAVTLYYDNASKLATTSTGIDVTGTVVTDALRVETAQGNISITNTSSSLNFARAGGNYIRATNSSGDFNFITGADDFATFRLKLANNGDISFYEDTGTTAKFFWDASAESLGIGTSTIQLADVGRSALEVNGSTNSLINLKRGDANSFYIQNYSTGIDFWNSNNTFMRFVNNSVERMRIDSSGNVGIGTSSPAYTLDFGTAASGHVIRVGDENQDAYMSFSNPRGFSGYSAGQNSMAIQGGFNKGIVFNVNNGTFGSGEAARIDSSGNVGIGVTDPVGRLEVKNSGNDNGFEFLPAYSSNINLMNSYNRNANTYYPLENRASYFMFKNGTSEAMRIDSSGNLLVGRTSSSGFTTSAGSAHFPNGAIFTTVDSGTALNVSRLTSDGDIVGFYKDGTTVGSIGSYTSLPYIGKSDVTLLFDPSGPHIIPRGTNGGARDAAINLGASTNRFKDLYLSGGVYLGGTGSANKLDDYESGTWTPTFTSTGTDPTVTYGTRSASYRKVGSLVTVWIDMTVSSYTGGAGNGTIGGLPFSQSGSARGVISGRSVNGITYDKGLQIELIGGTGYFSEDATGDIPLSDFSTGGFRIIMSGSYTTA